MEARIDRGYVELLSSRQSSSSPSLDLENKTRTLSPLSPYNPHITPT